MYLHFVRARLFVADIKWELQADAEDKTLGPPKSTVKIQITTRLRIF